MGVRGYLWMLQKCIPKSIITTPMSVFDTIYVDGNCVIHDVVDHLTELSVEIVAEAVRLEFEKLLSSFTYEKAYVVFDGVPPKPKQYCQRLRRINPSNEISPYILPGTTVMAAIEEAVKTLCNSTVTLNGSDQPGEGEHKIMGIIRTNPMGKILILTSDSDLVILSQVLMYGGIEARIFVKTRALMVDVNRVHARMSKMFTVDSLLYFCRACGNDYFPKLEELRDATCAEIFRRHMRANPRLRGLLDFDMEVTELIGIQPTDLSVGRCVCDLDEEHKRIYYNLALWYVKYFTTNECLSCEHYELDTTPCCHCLATRIEEPLKTIPLITEDHLSFVFNR